MLTDDEQTLTLKAAAERFGFPVATLRAEAGRGRLVIYKIGRTHYTTPNDIKAMVQKCRVENHPRACTSTKCEDNGLFATAHISSARDALRSTLNGHISS